MHIIRFVAKGDHTPRIGLLDNDEHLEDSEELRRDAVEHPEGLHSRGGSPDRRSKNT